MRILIFHGYLLRGTGSNIYNASLVRALVRLGHEVHLLCQDRHAGELDFVDATATWSEGRLEVRTLREPVRCTAYLPDIGEVLPVYVADAYEGFRAVPFPATGPIQRSSPGRIARSTITGASPYSTRERTSPA